jgi:hypothetical protein
MKNYIAPKFKSETFTCPHSDCSVLARHSWSICESDDGYSHIKASILRGCSNDADFDKQTQELDYKYVWKSTCLTCEKISIWFHGNIFYPDSFGIEKPNQDLNQDIQDDYLEAASIVNKSPRGACALLRLAIEKLCNQLIDPSNKKLHLDKKIELLKSKGLTERIYKNLLSVRVIGNEAVHCGTLDLKDNLEVTKQLFYLVNRIAEELITNPKNDESMFQSLPDNKAEEINKRINGNQK